MPKKKVYKSARAQRSYLRSKAEKIAKIKATKIANAALRATPGYIIVPKVDNVVRGTLDQPSQSGTEPQSPIQEHPLQDIENKINEVGIEQALSDKQLDDELKLEQKIQQAAQAANDTIPKSPQEILYEQFKANPLLFGLLFLPHHFRLLPPPLFHVKIITECMKNRFLAVQAPRESAKSTIVTFLQATHGICFKRFRFIVIVQNTFNKAAGSLDSIKKEFKDNRDLLNSFPVTITRDAQGDSIFRHPDGFETRVICKGADQIGSVRGEKFGAWRPDLIIIDDLEDDELVKNPERRKELQDLYDEALIPAGESGKVQVLAIGTILHDDCQMAKLVDPDLYTEYRKLFYTARHVGKLDGLRHSLWPEKWSLEYLDRLEQDKPAVFAKEYMGDPAIGSQETIRREDFRYWKVDNNRVVLLNEDNTVQASWDYKECKAAIAIDLAWEDKQSSDFSAVVPALLTPGNDILIDSYVAKKGLRPDELENIIFEMSKKYEMLTGKRVQIGLEKAKLEKVMKWFLSEAQRRRNQWLWLKDISWGTKDKVERILARVGNRYAQHAIFHKKGMGDLENQLVRLRSVAHDDIADCVGMLPEMLAYAPNIIKKADTTDMFEWWRNVAIKEKQQKNGTIKKDFVYGQKNKGFVLPSTQSYK